MGDTNEEFKVRMPDVKPLEYYIAQAHVQAKDKRFNTALYIIGHLAASMPDRSHMYIAEEALRCADALITASNQSITK